MKNCSSSMAYAETIACFFLMIAFLGASMAEEYTVGDAAGWNTGVDYNAWASKYTFRQGDTLRFVYQGDHEVVEVTEREFERCKVESVAPIRLSTGDDRVRLDDSGVYYFLCDFANMCESGMKIQIRVLSPGENGGAPTPPAPLPFFPVTPPTPFFFPQSPPSPDGNSPPPPMPCRSDGAPAAAFSLSTFITLALWFLH